MVTSAPVPPRARVMIAIPSSYPGGGRPAQTGTSLPSPGRPARRGDGGLTVGVERAGVLGDVDRVLLERGQRNDLEGALVGRREHDGGRQAVPVGAQPVGGRDAPAVARHETGK